MLDQDEINKMLAEETAKKNLIAEEEESSSNDETLSSSDVDSIVEKIQSDDIEVSTNEIEDIVNQAEIEDLRIDEEIKDLDDDIKYGSESWAQKQIKEGHLPYPVIDANDKFVGQLSQVTEEGEEKAGEVFDSILAAAEELDKANILINNLKIKAEAQDKFIFALQTKFPNINIFNQKSLELKDAIKEVEELESLSNGATNHLYKAMETMQFQDISRQKIERVISVVKKLSHYLTNVFDVDSHKEDIQVAKHIAGDKKEEGSLASSDDINNLIKEFEITT
jgi:hypothetical protein